MKTQKLENGQFDLQEEFEYQGVKFTCKSWGKGSTAHSFLKVPLANKRKTCLRRL